MSEKHTESESTRSVLWIAFATASTLATLDFAVGVSNAGPRAPLGEFALVWGAAFAVGAAAFAIAYGVARALTRRAPEADARAAAVAVAAGEAVFVGCSLGAGFDYVAPTDALEFLFFAALGAVVTWVVARALARWNGFARALRASVLAAPTIAFEIALCCAFAKRSWFAIQHPSAAIALLVAAAAATFFAVRAWTARRPGVAAPSLAVHVGALATLVAVAAVERERAPPRHEPKAGAPRSQVILITVDTLRADALSCYSPTAPRTPAIDELAGQAVLFESARSSAPWTMPSMASVLTGAAPQVHLVSRPNSRLPNGVPTLAERFARAGYATASIGNNVVLLEPSGMQRGFEQSIFFPRDEARTPFGSRVLKLFGRGPALDGDARDLVDLAREWIGEHQRESFFLWLHVLDPHLAYEPPDEFAPAGKPPPGMSTRFARGEDIRTGRYVPTLEERSWIRALYDGEVRSIDANLARLFARLKELGLFDDAVIAFSSDHGEEFWEHGRFEHGQAFYDELLRVPLIVKPAHSREGTRIAEPVANASLAPTLCALAGVEHDSSEFSWPELFERAGEQWKFSGAQRAVASFPLFFAQKSVIVENGFKYVRDAVTGEEELFDLAADPKELHSIAASSPERLASARAALDDELRRAAQLRTRWKVQANAVDLDTDTAARMRQLGYVK